MTVIARNFSSPDVPNLWAWRPLAAEAFCLVEFEVSEEERGDLFSCVVATPEALGARRSSGQLVIRDRATLVVDEFDWPRIQRFIEEVVTRCAHSDWSMTSGALQRWFMWEYESMR
jgi:hypothetical protein